MIASITISEIYSFFRYIFGTQDIFDRLDLCSIAEILNLGSLQLGWRYHMLLIFKDFEDIQNVLKNELPRSKAARYQNKFLFY